MLEGKTLLVVGVGDGLGREIAIAAVRDGASVMLAARREDNLHAVARDLDPDGGRVDYRATDMTDAAQLEDLLGQVDMRFGQLDGLVICAVHDVGIGGIESTTDEDWLTSFEVNVFAAARVVKAAVPMLKRRGGSIVFIGSQQWIYPARDVPQLAYGASKGAGVSMMYALCQELGPHKIRVNTVVPSWMWGPTVQSYIKWQATKQQRPAEEITAELRTRFALGEMPTDGDIAETACFFLSDRARAISGQSLLVNAGELAR